MSDSMPTHNPAPDPPDQPPEGATDQAWVSYLLQVQAVACRALGSPLYAELLDAAAADVRTGGPAWEVLAPHATRDSDSALALRLMAAVHRLVLTRRAPALALHYPSVGGEANRPGAWDALRGVLVEHAALLRTWIARPCQTNEVARCAALAGGFLMAAAETGLPLRLLEVGASAGLNLRWDRYFYRNDSDDRCWGDASSPVQLVGHWEVDRALLETRVRILERAGCDPHPIDPTTAEGRLSLTASVWADQPQRVERLRGAMQVAQQVPVAIAQARAIEWLPARLDALVEGTATVVYHSVVLQYLDPQERSDVAAGIAAAGDRATPAAPLYWLRMEPEDLLRAMSVRLTRWPGGDDVLLATAGAHGAPLRWRC